MDMGGGYTPEQWQAWKEKQRAAHNNGNGHGASLTQEALTMNGENMAQQYGDGS
jgi:DNA (cytosine-5)-methyltransferase 1